MQGRLSVPARAAIILVCCAAGAQAAMGQGIIKNLPRPGDREFVLDLADMVSFEDEEEIKRLCDELLTAKATPIFVVTIRSMSDHGGRGMRIETFARLLFDQWRIGIPEINKKKWNTGILLLVSKRDRKARIELGGGWKLEKDDLCEEIMDELIIPKFKDRQFSAGILAGVEALDRMARDLKIPTRMRSIWYYVAVVAAIALALATAHSLCTRGVSGWGWFLWATVFTSIGTILYTLLNSSSESGFFDSDGGGFSGGGFGGGSSGGGGATGSW